LNDVQPYYKGNGENIWRISRLDNIDKHRILLACEDITGIGGDFSGAGIDFQNCRLENQSLTGALYASNAPLSLGDETILTFRVIIAEKDHFYNEDLLSTIDNLIKNVKITISNIIKECE
jgi:hypothetical protein